MIGIGRGDYVNGERCGQRIDGGQLEMCPNTSETHVEINHTDGILFLLQSMC